MTKINSYNYLRPITELINEYSSKATNKTKIDEAKKLFKEALLALEESISKTKEPEIDEEALLEEEALKQFPKIKKIKDIKSPIVKSDTVEIHKNSLPTSTDLPVMDITPNENLGDSDLFNF